MSSFAHIEYAGPHPAIESLATLGKRIWAAVRPTFARWAAARQQAALERIMREVPLTDRRLAGEIRAICDRAAATGIGC